MLNTTKRNGRTIAIRIDKQTYGRLLAETLPAAIETEVENRRMIAIASRLMDKAERSPEESKLLKLIALLCQEFEQKFYKAGATATPEGILADLMAERGLKQADLLPVFGSRSVVSEVLSAKRGITKKQVKALGKFFQVSPELFI
jgi:HTH-type transcriptional regulator / antitoxin HigA